MAYNLHYQREGEGEVIVLLHGFLTSSHYFKKLQKRLSTTYTVISIDLLGFGKSPKPVINFTYNDHIEAIHTTLQNINVTKFYLAGHSLGGLLALRYATTYPNEVQRLMLFNPPMYKNADQAFATLTSTKFIKVMLHSQIKYFSWRVLKFIPHFPRPDRPSINLTDVLRATPASRQQTYDNVILQGAFFKDVAAVTTPTLLVVGKRDRKQYQLNIQEWQKPSNLKLLLLNTGHHTPLRTVNVATYIKQFATIEPMPL